MIFPELEFAISAFVAGLITFLAPCTFPLIPAYLSFIGGTSVSKLSGVSKARLKIVLNGVFFILGFSLVFIILGTLLGFLSQVFGPSFQAWFARIGGVIIIFFGLFMLKIVNIEALNTTAKLRFPNVLKPGSATSSFLMGISLGAGWSPCIGPVLGSILGLAAASGATAVKGGILLAIFSAGLAVPFLIIALGLSSALNQIKKFEPYLPWVERFGGVLLIIIGGFLLANEFGLFIQWAYDLAPWLEEFVLENT
jgi:cytochrome c-type biogenesis protein